MIGVRLTLALSDKILTVFGVLGGARIVNCNRVSIVLCSEYRDGFGCDGELVGPSLLLRSSSPRAIMRTAKLRERKPARLIKLSPTLDQPIPASSLAGNDSRTMQVG